MEGDSQTGLELKSTRHAMYWCGYHFAWIPKYRRGVLVGEVAEYTREVLKQIFVEIGCEPIAIEVLPDHVHVFCSCPPRLSPAYVVNYLKGKSARRILQRFPELKTGATRGKLWSRSYFVATVGNISADIIRKYVEEQWEKER
ncbi:MAG: IS200/IS605 family transposase [Fervidicoccaceae archaeon]